MMYVDEKVIETSKINFLLHYFNIHAYSVSILKISYQLSRVTL